VVLDIADDGLIRVDCDMPDRDLLLTSTAVVIDPFGKHDHRALRLVGKLQVSGPRLEIFRRLRPGFRVVVIANQIRVY